MPSEEQWREIPGFPGYEVSDRGRIRTFWERGARPPRLCAQGHVMKLLPNPRGYLYAKLCYQGRRRTTLIHRLVLEVFVGPPSARALGLHRDDDRLNNSLENLYWGDWVSNSKDKHRNGKANVGERNGQARLTGEQVAEIFRRRRQGELLTSIAKDFDISPSNVSAIGVGRSWTWLTSQG